MKIKDVLKGLLGVVIFFLLIKIIFFSAKPYYEPKKYLKTIEKKINGEVTRIVVGKNFFGVVIDNEQDSIYPLTYLIEKTPKNWRAIYPKDFIIVGDSIKKKEKNDTFLVIRDKKSWLYILPD